MIVRNEEENLPHCLESVRGLFDEIVVVDTGSTDRTNEIAREFGAKVFDFAWIDDFAAARNESLRARDRRLRLLARRRRRARAAEREKLAALLDRLRTGRRGRLRGALRLRSGARRQRRRDRRRSRPALPAPRRPAVDLSRPRADPARHCDRAEIPVRWTDVIVRHTGYVDPALRARKLDRDAKILREELKVRPDEPFILFNLGAIAIERQRWQGASITCARAWTGRRRATRSPGSCLP